MNDVTWLHLSDFHFNIRAKNDSEIVLERLLDDIRDCISCYSLNLNFIIISGDIAFSGKTEEYDLAAKFFDKLLTITGLTPDYLFMVPGNHDVDRNEITELSSKITNFESRKEVNRFLDCEKDLRNVLSKLKNYQNFLGKYQAETQEIIDNGQYFYVKHININENDVAILCLNSSWASGPDDKKGKLIVGDRQIIDSIKQSDEADLRLAVLHHPLDWLKEFDLKSTRNNLLKKCMFVLHGHNHNSDFIKELGPSAGVIKIAAGAAYESRDYPNSYNFVTVNLQDRNGKIYFRTYAEDGEYWTKNVMISKEMDNGIYEFELPADIKNFSIRRQKIKIISDTNREKMNRKADILQKNPQFGLFEGIIDDTIKLNSAKNISDAERDYTVEIIKRLVSAIENGEECFIELYGKIALGFMPDDLEIILGHDKVKKCPESIAKIFWNNQNDVLKGFGNYIPVVLVVMNRAEAEFLANNNPYECEAAKLKREFLFFRELLKNNWHLKYNAHSKDWLPFNGSKNTIEKLIIYSLVKFSNYEKPIVPIFISLNDIIHPAYRYGLNILRQNGCVVVVDPISLRHPELQRNFRKSSLDLFSNTLVAKISDLDDDSMIIHRLSHIFERYEDLELYKRNNIDHDAKCMGFKEENAFVVWLADRLTSGGIHTYFFDAEEA